MVKSKDASCDEDNGNDSKPYSNNGMHLLESSCSVTSSEAIMNNSNVYAQESTRNARSQFCK